MFKYFKFRVYPSSITVSRLREWNNAMKCVWNIAHEQRLIGLSRSKGEKIYVSTHSQQLELTELRRVYPWIKDVPRHVIVQVLKNLDEAWQRCFNKTARRPKWKKKSDQLSFWEFDHLQWTIKDNKLKFPKLAPMKIVLHRPLEGKPKSCTLKRDGDQWFACIVCDVVNQNLPSRTEPIIALDRGLTNFIGTSDRVLVPNPKFLEKGLAKLARAQRTVSRRVKGSKNREKVKNRVSRIHRTIRRQRDHFLHVLSSQITKSHGVVVLEKLNVKGMIRNHCLARSISGASWSRFALYLEYKMKWAGGSVTYVPAHHTSQTCSSASCKHVDPESRKGEKFCCTKCGFTLHADINAAINILSRANRSVQPVEGSSNCAPRRSRKVEILLKATNEELTAELS